MGRVVGHGVVTSEPKTAGSRRKIALFPYIVEVLKQHRIRQSEARLQAGPKGSSANNFHIMRKYVIVKQ